MSESMHPYAPDRVIVERDSFLFSVGDPQALWEHFNALHTRIVCALSVYNADLREGKQNAKLIREDLEIAATGLEMLMCAATIAGERTHA